MTFQMGGGMNKTKIISLALILSTSTALAAEKSGFFVGAGVSANRYQKMEMGDSKKLFIQQSQQSIETITQKISSMTSSSQAQALTASSDSNNANLKQQEKTEMEKTITTVKGYIANLNQVFNSTSGEFNNDLAVNGFSYQLIAGYKYMLPEFSNLGFRAYVNYEDNRDNVSLVGLNIDALYNFDNNSSSNSYNGFGVFAGVGFGMEEYYHFDYDFYVAIQAGLRATFDDKHTIEIFATTPLTKYKSEKIKIESQDLIKNESKKEFGIGTRYIYNF